MAHRKFFLLISLSLFVVFVKAQIRLPLVIGSNMVLQQQQSVPVWGWTVPGKTVRVVFGSQTRTALADDEGRWQVNLTAMPASSTPGTMTITSDTSHVVLSNILVGEVWLCSGQSNMEYPMKKYPGYTNPNKGIDSAELELQNTNPDIRLFKVEKKLSTPDVTSSGWHESGGEALEQISAAAYYFAKNLYGSLRVPVGIISSSWGGSRIEPWTPAAAYASLPQFASETKEANFRIDGVVPGRNYNSMIAPLAPFAIKGVLWYQGESNCMLEEPGMRYADKMLALVEGWRSAFQNHSLPFYEVLIAPYYYTKRKDKLPHTDETLPLFWEQQIAAAQMPHTGFVTVTDLVDDLRNIHPSYKWEVGRRLALVALAKTYGQGIEYSGPEFQRMKRKGNKLVLYFDHANGMKTLNGEPPDFFTIAGADGNFVQANAVIKGTTVILSSPQLAKPVNARFAWTETARPNLVNATGLPAVPFRTDALKWK